MIFMLEIWERFGFYTVQGILTLYFVRFLGFSQTQAYFALGAFSALVYGMISVGGYLGDWVLGTKRTIVLGMVVLALGYLALALATRHTVFFALGLIATGNGLFKANPASLLARCYAYRDPRLHSAFTLYYMAVNLGSAVALLVGPSVSSRYGYFYAYFISFLGLLAGLVSYGFQHQYAAHVNNEADKKQVAWWVWGLVIVGIAAATGISGELLQHVQVAKALVGIITVVVLGIYCRIAYKEDHLSRQHMAIALLLMAEAVIFFTLYQQMPTSLNVFAVQHVRAVLWGISFDPQSFQALNPFWIITLSPVLATLYSHLVRRGINFSMPYKFTAGMTCCGISFLLLYFCRFFYDEAYHVSAWWLVASYLFQSTGELLVSALGVAMVAELVPVRLSGFVMGMWFLTSAIAGFVGAQVASYTSIPHQDTVSMASLLLYTDVFAWIGLITLGITGVIGWLAHRLTRLYG